MIRKLLKENKHKEVLEILEILENYSKIKKGWEKVDQENSLINENINNNYCWNYNFNFNNENTDYNLILNSKEDLKEYLFNTYNDSIYNFESTIEELNFFFNY